MIMKMAKPKSSGKDIAASMASLLKDAQGADDVECEIVAEDRAVQDGVAK